MPIKGFGFGSRLPFSCIFLDLIASPQKTCQDSAPLLLRNTAPPPQGFACHLSTLEPRSSSPQNPHPHPSVPKQEQNPVFLCGILSKSSCIYPSPDFNCQLSSQNLQVSLPPPPPRKLRLPSTCIGMPWPESILRFSPLALCEVKKEALVPFLQPPPASRQAFLAVNLNCTTPRLVVIHSSAM